MKGAPNRKKEQPKKETDTLQEPDLLASSTPEISARSRDSLGMFAMSKDDDKEQQIMQLQELLADQQRELMEKQEALRESQERQLFERLYKYCVIPVPNATRWAAGPAPQWSVLLARWSVLLARFALNGWVPPSRPRVPLPLRALGRLVVLPLCN